jgi:hypothetical protein
MQYKASPKTACRISKAFCSGMARRRESTSLRSRGSHPRVMNKCVKIVFTPLLLSALVVCGQNAPQPQTSSGSSRPQSAEAERALLDQYCAVCHNQKTKGSGSGQAAEASRKLTLDNADLEHVSADPEMWEKVVRKLRAGMMPPSGARRPDAATYEGMITWLENELDRNVTVKLPPPGLHRLNRAEYSTVVRDLLGVEVDASKFLPSDDSSHGFDNMAGTLTVSPALLEAYLSAAGKISRLAIGDTTAPSQTVYNVPVDTSQNYHVEGLPFGTRGGTLIKHNFAVDGEYIIRVYTVKKGNMGGAGAFGGISGEKLEISVDGERAALVDWDRGVAPPTGNGEPGHIEVKTAIKAGVHSIGVTFVATNYAPINDLLKQFRRTTIETGGIEGYTFFPHVGSVWIEGPYNAAGALDSPSRRKIFSCTPKTANEETACAGQIISTLARRAFRKPPSPENMESLMEAYRSGRKSRTFDSGIEMAIRALLADPNFIYRGEAEPAGIKDGQTYRISDLELASRLSFFLWNSGPDDELLNMASQGRLKDPAVLEKQTRRMLADGRSEAFIVNFAGQWLNLRGLQATYPTVMLYPDFDDNLRQAMRREGELFFGSIVREDRNVLDLLTADYTYLNERLAKHYGVPNVYGTQMRRVSLGPEFDVRRGLLGKGALLAVTSKPDRTSPVVRGKTVMELILGISPPAPPPVVPALEATKGQGKVLSVRQQMELHRKVEPCASCHKIMDPIGLSLENFDATGIWRAEDQGIPIDASGQFVDGVQMRGPVGLREALLHYSPQFIRNLTENLMTYALGRGVEYYDMPAIRSIVRDAARNENRFSSIVLGIVKSSQFQMNMKMKSTD